MRSLHVPFGYFPDPAGGTEVYVAALAAELERRGHRAAIAAPGAVDAAYRHDGRDVYRIGVPAYIAPLDMYGGGVATTAVQFGRILDRERPDVVHLHAFTPAVSIRVVREATRRGLPVVFTYHTPSASCVRGTLMLDGAHACDGRLDVARCTRCALLGRGMPGVVATLASLMPPLPVTPRPGALRTFWSTGGYSTLVAGLHDAVRALFAEVDRIVAPRAWVEALLVGNGVPGAKIVRSAQPLCYDVTTPRADRHTDDGPLRVAFLGRLDPVKGLDVLLRAVRLLPDQTRLELDVFGVVEGSGSSATAARLRTQFDDLARVRVHAPVVPADVVPTLRRYDLLAVPSQWLETGPLVVLEAHAAGIGVVASALGGLLELVDPEVTGTLVRDYASPAAWAEALAGLAADRARVRAFGAAAPRPRTIGQVCDEMLAVYASLRPGAESRRTPAASAPAQVSGAEQ